MSSDADGEKVVGRYLTPVYSNTVRFGLTDFWIAVYKEKPGRVSLDITSGDIDICFGLEQEEAEELSVSLTRAAATARGQKEEPALSCDGCRFLRTNLCVHPAMLKARTDIYGFSAPPARELRYPSGLCGPDARLFEEPKT